MSESASGHCSCHFVAVENKAAVDDNVGETDGVLMRFFEGGFISDGIGVEDHDVRGKAFADLPSIAEVERLPAARSFCGWNLRA